MIGKGDFDRTYQNPAQEGGHKAIKVGRGFNPNLFSVRPVGSKSQLYFMVCLTSTTLVSSHQSQLRWRREWPGSEVADGIKGLHPDQLFTSCNDGLSEFSIVFMDLSIIPGPLGIFHHNRASVLEKYQKIAVCFFVRGQHLIDFNTLAVPRRNKKKESANFTKI